MSAGDPRHGSDGLLGYESMRCAAGMDGCDDRACICLCHHRLGSYEEVPYGCPTCRTILNAKRAGGCPDLWHSDNRPTRDDIQQASAALDEQLKRVDEAQRRMDEVLGSTPVSEEPAEGSTVSRELTVRQTPSPDDVLAEAASLFGEALMRHRNQGQALIPAVDLAYARGISEGHRQATEGWEREWGAQYRDDSWVQATFDDQASATEFAAGAIGHRAVSRLVGPWEPAEQPAGSDRDA